MNCPKCGTKINELTEICPKCGVNLDELDQEEFEEEDSQSYTTGNKTILLNGINLIQIISFSIMAIASWIDGNILNGFINLGVGLITFALLKGFEDIIDLLDSINNKLK